MTDEIKKQAQFKHKRGRKNPAVMPSKLTRTSAFAPRRRGLVTDSNFRKLYIIPGYSVIEVSGREMGAQHRDLATAIFRHKAKVERYLNPDHNPNITGQGQPPKYIETFEVTITWRSLLQKLGLSEQTNNRRALLERMTDLQKVVLIVHDGDPERILEAFEAGKLGKGGGRSSSIIQEIEWDADEAEENGLSPLDSKVRIKYGGWVRKQFDDHRLVSVNAEVQFALKSDYAKTFWPFIDSQPTHTWIDEEMLGKLSGRDLWGEHENADTRKEFRRAGKKAFDDMVQAGGLASYEIEQRGSGKRKTRRYHYTHALPFQFGLELPDSE